MPAPLDVPTEACSLVSALLAAVLQEASQTLQGSNLVSFNAEVNPLLSGFASFAPVNVTPTTNL